MNQKQIKMNLFSWGEPSDITSWSNVPYFFSKALAHYGVQVNGVNLMPTESWRHRLVFGWCRAWRRAARVIGHPYARRFPMHCRLTQALIKQKIKTVSQKHADADLNVFLNYSFSSYLYTDTPVAHYCDITYEHFLNTIGAADGPRDAIIIQSQQRILAHADYVFTMSQRCHDYIQQRYFTKRLFKLEAGTNLELNRQLDPEQLITQKLDRKEILFIGKPPEERGVDILIEAFKQFNNGRGGEFRLHIVGATRKEIGEADERIRFYGYLNKADPTDLKTYIELLETAYLFVFPMRGGLLPGAIREAHLMCTPAIISNVANPSERVQHGVDGIIVDGLEASAKPKLDDT